MQGSAKEKSGDTLEMQRTMPSWYTVTGQYHYGINPITKNTATTITSELQRMMEHNSSRERDKFSVCGREKLGYKAQHVKQGRTAI